MTALPLLVELAQATEHDTLEALLAVAYDRTGRAVAHTLLKPVREGDRLIAKAELAVSPKEVGDVLRLVLAPLDPTTVRQLQEQTRQRPTRGQTPNDVAKLPLPPRGDLIKRLRGYQDVLRFNPLKPELRIVVPRPDWSIWTRLCFCWVKGRLVKRVRLPDGRTLDLPICHARVTLCEIDRWPILIGRLPDPDILRLRDEILDRLRQPIPQPGPIPEPFPDPIPRLGLPVPPTPLPLFARLPAKQAAGCGCASASESDQAELAVVPLRDFDPQPDPPLLARLSALAAAPAAVVRARLVEDWVAIRPWLCGAPWLDRLFETRRHCFATVTTDGQGRFSALYVHACGDADRPDIYVSAEQEIGGVWTSIHAPSVSCGTTWDYRCGDEILVVVTDPRARACVPEEPVEPPPGVGPWVMPYAVGATTIAGSAGAAPPGGWPEGWVRPDGLTDHGGLRDAPFGSVLGFRQQHALSIPNDGLYFYRWSFRRGTSGDWTAMTAPITRTYVRDIPGPAVQFPVVTLGPNANNLFRFRPALFNPADWGVDTSSDPTGTAYYWPVDAGIGEVFAARWTTPGAEDAATAPALAGTYQVLLQVFRKDGTLVPPGPSTFQFIVPTRVDADGTVHTRLAQPSEIVDGGFVFTLVIDNGRCGAEIAPPTISAPGTADNDCGFLRYPPVATVGLAFTPTHPAGRATFGFALVRGATGVGVAAASGEVTAATAGSYTRFGTTFRHGFAVGDLVGPCTNAAFAARLVVYAKATNGARRLTEYDADFTRAFALSAL